MINFIKFKIFEIAFFISCLLLIYGCGDRDYELRLIIQGQGSVEVENISYSENKVFTFEVDETVTLEAIADNGWDFDSWDGNLVSESNSSTTTKNENITLTAKSNTITMNEDKEITAKFKENNAIVKGTLKFEDESVSNIQMYATTQIVSISDGSPYTGPVIGNAYLSDSDGYYELKIPFESSVESKNIYIFALRNGHLIYQSEQFEVQRFEILIKDVILTNYMPKLNVDIRGYGNMQITSANKDIVILYDTTLIYKIGTNLTFTFSHEPDCLTLTKWSIESEGLTNTFSSNDISYYTSSYTILRDTKITASFENARTYTNTNDFVFNQMKASYYYDENIPEEYTKTASYSASYTALFDDLTSESDDFSFIIDYNNNFLNYFDKYPGFGFFTKFNEANDLRIKFVYPNSYAAYYGLLRGDRVIKINDKEPHVEESYLDTIFSVNNKYNTIELTTQESSGLTWLYQINATDEWINFDTILKNSIINIQINNIDKKIAYLVLQSFNNININTIDLIFQKFKDENVDDLVVDLRYNTSGSLLYAKYIGELIGGARVANETYIYKKYNEKNESKNISWEFESEPSNALSITRVFFITSESTCYASEALINSLKPFLEVITVGKTTCGNSWGMEEYDLCDFHLNIVEYLISNSDGDSYTQGINPTCKANDDVTKPFGDIDEASLKEVLYYMENGTCIED